MKEFIYFRNAVYETLCGMRGSERADATDMPGSLESLPIDSEVAD